MIELGRHDAASAQGLLEELTVIYRESWAASDDPFRGRAAFQERFASHMRTPGFVLVTAHEGDRLIGYVYGSPLPHGTRWWNNTIEPVSSEMTREDGKRTLGINELHVRTEWRRRGIARSLHDEYLRDRGAQRATLTVDPSNTVALAVYRSWGWHTIGQVKPFPDSPTFDLLLRDLPTAKHA